MAQNITIERDIHNEDMENLCQFEHSQPIEPIITSSSLTPLTSYPPQSSPPPYSSIPGTVPLYYGRRGGPPPSYDDVINPDAPPPSYNSLFGQVREARKASHGFIDFLRKVIMLLIGTLGCTILIGFTVVIPVTMIIIGASYMHECPAENIPTFLIVGGVVWIFKNLMGCYFQCRQSDNEDANENVSQHRRHESLLNCFLFGWFIAGCVLVYRLYEPNYTDMSSPNYCHRTIYMYAFWLVTGTFIIFGLFIGCLCCLTISSIIANNEERDS